MIRERVDGARLAGIRAAGESDFDTRSRGEVAQLMCGNEEFGVLEQGHIEAFGERQNAITIS